MVRNPEEQKILSSLGIQFQMLGESLLGAPGWKGLPILVSGVSAIISMTTNNPLQTQVLPMSTYHLLLFQLTAKNINHL